MPELNSTQLNSTQLNSPRDTCSDEEGLRAVEEDIRNVEEEIRSVKKGAEIIEREIEETSNPENIRALRRSLHELQREKAELQHQKIILLQDRTTLRERGSRQLWRSSTATMDEEQLRALEEDIRIVDEDIRSLKKRAEDTDREIADTSDPGRIKTLRQLRGLIDKSENILLQRKLFVCKERANLRGQRPASEPIFELVKQVNLRLGCIEQNLVKYEQNFSKKFEELYVLVASRSSSMASTSYPDKGCLVRKSTARLHLPPPLIGKEAENMWPEGSWKTRGRRSAAKDFRELVNELRYCALSPWNIIVTGCSSSVCGLDLKPDVYIYKRPQSPGVDPVPLTTGVILELKSGTGKYNNDLNLGKAAHYGEKMLENLRGFRSSVLVGVTDLEKVQWFKVIRTGRNIFKYEVHDELNDVRGSLCALLKSSLSDLGVELPPLTVCGVEHAPIRFLGSGVTSNVLCVKGEDGGEYAAKVPLTWKDLEDDGEYSDEDPFSQKDLENDHRMLTALDHVEGVPKVLGWFDDGVSLKIHPVGRQLSRKYLSCWSWMVPGLVDVLRKAHDLGIINRDVRPDNIMIAKGESEETEMLYILDWGYAVMKNQFSVFCGGVAYASERILGQLADGDFEVLAEGRDDLEALVHTIFSLRFHEQHKLLRGLKRHDFGELRMFWSKCFDEYPAWKSALTAARSEDYLKLKCEFKELVSNSCLF